MCIDDSIYNEFLCNKTRSSLISNCVVELINSGFGEKLYHYSEKNQKNLNVKEAMAMLYWSKWLSPDTWRSTVQGDDQDGFNKFGRRGELDFIHCVLLALQLLFLGFFAGAWRGAKCGVGEVGSSDLLALNYRMLLPCLKPFWLWSRRRHD